jgi:hypothetical protein
MLEVVESFECRRLKEECKRKKIENNEEQCLKRSKQE